MRPTVERHLGPSGAGKRGPGLWLAVIAGIVTRRGSSGPSRGAPAGASIQVAPNGSARFVTGQQRQQRWPRWSISSVT
jgi:hypothetical protein